MTIPVPPDLTTDAADAYRAGYRRACADLAEAAMARVREPGARAWAEVSRRNLEQPGDREPTGLDGRGA